MSLPVVCSLGLLVIIHAAGGMQLEPQMPHMTCQCLKVTSHRLNPKLFKKIDIYPVKNYCPRMEILVTMTNNNIICVHPEAKWFASIMQRLLQKNKGNQKN